MIPNGWTDVMTRTVVALATAVLALGVKEWVEARQVDLPGISIDGLWVAAGALVVNGLLRALSPAKHA